ncbi:hypothetical protein AGMMS4952_11780 [Spirochaetia bacterium]|nr:hypothetical protein AGMMS4952_11780 [Spirochaetia bacterium]
MKKKRVLTAMFSKAALAAVLALGMVFTGCGDKGSGDSTSPTDTRTELTAGGAVNLAYTATTADITFTGAAGLSLAAADFTVTTGGVIGTPAVSDNTVTVPVTFAENNGALPKTFTVGINSGSAKIKGSATVMITQAVAPNLDTRVELTAGSAVSATYNATTADVTFTGATGLTLTAADFTVTTGGTIGTPAVSGSTVTVPVTFAANTGALPKTYTVGVNNISSLIKGSATVVITQAVAPNLDTRVELTAGSAVSATYNATTADVTFTGATGLTLTAADFTVTTGGTIGTPAVSGSTVTVPVTFAANTGALPKTYTVGVNNTSSLIKGSATVVITQAADPVLDTRVELTAGSTVSAAYTATTADVTFTGATGLSLTAADFTVTTGGVIGTPAVSGDIVTVPVTFTANTDTSPKTYTVGIDNSSTWIKGSATVVITQGADTRDQLTAGSAVDAAYTATDTNVTFTGASGLSLAAEDFTVTTGGVIGTPAVSGDTVTVPVIFPVNTGTSAQTYTVGISADSTRIKGSATVVITQEADTRDQLTAGSMVDAAYTATGANVTFTGASGFSLAADDFTVSGGGTIGTPAGDDDTVTVPVTFAANTDTSPKTYTVGINSSSTRIKGSATAVITQAAAPESGTAKVIYTWVNEHEIVTSHTTATLSRGENQSLTITVTGSGYSDYQWSLNGGDIAGTAGTTSYTFSSAGHGNGKYTIGLRLKSDLGSAGDAWYSTQITITVTN